MNLSEVQTKKSKPIWSAMITDSTDEHLFANSTLLGVEPLTFSCVGRPFTH
jgi:hypothetical protein